MLPGAPCAAGAPGEPLSPGSTNQKGEQGWESVAVGASSSLCLGWPWPSPSWAAAAAASAAAGAAGTAVPPPRRRPPPLPGRRPRPPTRPSSATRRSRTPRSPTCRRRRRPSCPSASTGCAAHGAPGTTPTASVFCITIWPPTRCRRWRSWTCATVGCAARSCGPSTPANASWSPAAGSPIAGSPGRSSARATTWPIPRSGGCTPRRSMRAGWPSASRPSSRPATPLGSLARCSTCRATCSCGWATPDCPASCAAASACVTCAAAPRSCLVQTKTPVGPVSLAGGQLLMSEYLERSGARMGLALVGLADHAASLTLDLGNRYPLVHYPADACRLAVVVAAARCRGVGHGSVPA